MTLGRLKPMLYKDLSGQRAGFLGKFIVAAEAATHKDSYAFTKIFHIESRCRGAMRGFSWHTLQPVGFRLILATAISLGCGVDPHRLKSVPL